MVSQSIRTNHPTKSSTPDHCRHMMAQQPLVRPSDQWMFPDDPDKLLETATANRRLGTWIASCWKVIKNSAKMTEKESSCGTANITSFFPPTNLDSVARIRCWHQDKLIHDGYCKKRGQKFQPTNRGAQPLITRYLTLSGQLDL